MRFSSSRCVQTSCDAHPASYPADTGVNSRDKERPEHDADHLHPSSAEVKNE
jgi:hypothetical protein